MKLLITFFILFGLIASPVVFAEGTNGAATADAGSDGKKDGKEAEEEEPDCD